MCSSSKTAMTTLNFCKHRSRRIGGIGVVGRVDNAERALESIQNLRPDVVLVDVYLRQGTGLDVIRAVRSESQLRQLKIVAMSSVALEEECVSAGADWFFDKADEAERLMTQFQFLKEVATDELTGLRASTLAPHD